MNSTSKFSRLNVRIQTIQSKIDNVNKLTDDAISKLEEHKRDLRGGINSEFPIIQRNIQEITIGHDRIVEKLMQRQTDAQKRVASLEVLDVQLCELDREISRIQSERDRTTLELQNKKQYLSKALRSTEDLMFDLQKLDGQIHKVEYNHEEEMQKLDEEKKAARNDLSQSQKELAIAELDRKVSEKQEIHDQHMSSLQSQKQESMMLLKEYDEDLAVEVAHNLQTEIDDLEAMKVGATPSETQAINERIAKLREQIDDIDILGELNARGLRLTPSGRIASDDGKIYTIEEAMAKGMLEGLDIMKLIVKNKLGKKGLKITKSGNLQTHSGKLLSLEEAKERGLVGESVIDAFNITIGRGSYSSLTSDAPSYMSSEDVHYLKTSVGKPLTMALAEICTKQPRDPIHYLGHWLFKYRYNQEIDEVKKRQIEQLMAERERIRIETWNKEVEDVARTAVLEMIFRAHDETMKHEIDKERSFAETDVTEEEGGGEEMDELAEEAKDILGEYTGPPAGQRRL